MCPSRLAGWAHTNPNMRRSRLKKTAVQAVESALQSEAAVSIAVRRKPQPTRRRRKLSTISTAHEVKPIKELLKPVEPEPVKPMEPEPEPVKPVEPEPAEPVEPVEPVEPILEQPASSLLVADDSSEEDTEAIAAAMFAEPLADVMDITDEDEEFAKLTSLAQPTVLPILEEEEEEEEDLLLDLDLDPPYPSLIACVPSREDSIFLWPPPPCVFEVFDEPEDAEPEPEVKAEAEAEDYEADEEESGEIEDGVQEAARSAFTKLGSWQLPVGVVNIAGHALWHAIHDKKEEEAEALTSVFEEAEISVFHDSVITCSDIARYMERDGLVKWTSRAWENPVLMNITYVPFPWHTAPVTHHPVQRSVSKGLSMVKTCLAYRLPTVRKVHLPHLGLHMLVAPRYSGAWSAAWVSRDVYGGTRPLNQVVATKRRVAGREWETASGLPHHGAWKEATHACGTGVLDDGPGTVVHAMYSGIQGDVENTVACDMAGKKGVVFTGGARPNMITGTGPDGEVQRTPTLLRDFAQVAEAEGCDMDSLHMWLGPHVLYLFYDTVPILRMCQE